MRAERLADASALLAWSASIPERGVSDAGESNGTGERGGRGRATAGGRKPVVLHKPTRRSDRSHDKGRRAGGSTQSSGGEQERNNDLRPPTVPQTSRTRLSCFFAFQGDCDGPIRPSAAGAPTHGYCQHHIEAGLERANWNHQQERARREMVFVPSTFSGGIARHGAE